MMTETTEQTMPQQLSSLIMDDTDFTKLNARQSVYCPFEALSVARLEIRHSNFLADIVDPIRPHGFEDGCTRALVETLLLEAGEQTLLLNLHLSDLGDVEIRREWQHIDLLIRVPGQVPADDVVLVVELKVEANESEGQLGRYEAVVSDTWPEAQKFFFFLTPDQSEASRDNWTSVGFSPVVDNFERVLEKGIGNPKARMMLQSYISMLRRRYVEDPDVELLVQRIWDKHGTALQFLEEFKPNPVEGLLDQIVDAGFLDEVNGRLKGNGRDCEIMIYKATSQHVDFRVPIWDGIPGMLSSTDDDEMGRIFGFRLNVDEQGVVVGFVIGPGDQDARIRLVEAMRHAGVASGIRKTISPYWRGVFKKVFRNKERIEKLAKGGFDESDVSKLREEVVVVVAKMVGAYDLAFQPLYLPGVDQN